jgi:hypothetical protein
MIDIGDQQGKGSSTAPGPGDLHVEKVHQVLAVERWVRPSVMESWWSSRFFSIRAACVSEISA